MSVILEEMAFFSISGVAFANPGEHSVLFSRMNFTHSCLHFSQNILHGKHSFWKAYLLFVNKKLAKYLPCIPKQTVKGKVLSSSISIITILSILNILYQYHDPLFH